MSPKNSRSRSTFWFALSWGILAAFTGCDSAAPNKKSPQTSESPSQQSESSERSDKLPTTKEEELLVAVAASVEAPVRKIAGALSNEIGAKITFSAGSSSQLAKQIEQGLEARVFIPASPEWEKYLADRDLVAHSDELLENKLVIVVPKSDEKTSAPTGLLEDSIKLVALGGPEVPAGKYGEQALRKHEVFEKLKESGRIVYTKDVVAAARLAASGEAEAAIVYSTDALANEGLRVAFEFSPEDCDRIVYPLVLIKPWGESSPAARFERALKSETAAKIFREAGFTVAQPKETTAP